MSISEQVIDLILEHAGALRDEILPEVYLEDDLGLTGDDAWELMGALHNKFNVDFTEFEFSLHFGPEAGLYVAKEYGYYPVSVQHLIEVTEDKKWKLPPKNEEHYQQYINNKRKWRIIVFTIIACVILYIVYTGTCT